MNKIGVKFPNDGTDPVEQLIWEKFETKALRQEYGPERGYVDSFKSIPVWNLPISIPAFRTRRGKRHDSHDGKFVIETF